MSEEKFLVGDKVRCFGWASSGASFDGETGEVDEISPYGVIVLFDTPDIQCFHPRQLELVERAKKKRKVKLLAWLGCAGLHWFVEDMDASHSYKRVPSEDKEVEVEE